MSEAEPRKPGVNETVSSEVFGKEKLRHGDWKSGWEPYQDGPFVPGEAINRKARLEVGIAE